jgi:predicted nucleic acid-binding protein
MNYADTGFLVSLYLPEATTVIAVNEIRRIKQPLALTPLLRLELRNALKFAVSRHRITLSDRDSVWKQIEDQLRQGFFVDVLPSTSQTYSKASELSDRYTLSLATRSLDLLHVATAITLSARIFYSFDERQRRAASAEGLSVKP